MHENYLSTEVYNSIKFFVYRNSAFNRTGDLTCSTHNLAHAIRECITNARIQKLRKSLQTKSELFPKLERPIHDLLLTSVNRVAGKSVVLKIVKKKKSSKNMMNFAKKNSRSVSDNDSFNG